MSLTRGSTARSTSAWTSRRPAAYPNPVATSAWPSGTPVLQASRTGGGASLAAHGKRRLLLTRVRRFLVAEGGLRPADGEGTARAARHRGHVWHRIGVLSRGVRCRLPGL